MRRMTEIIRHQNPLIMPPETSVREACQAMRDRRVGAVIVAENDRSLKGIFTGRDAICRVLAEGRLASRTKIGDVMTPHPEIIAAGKTAIDALRLMQEGHFRHLPILENNRIIGIVSKGDFRGLEQDRLDEETGMWERL